ncbi:MAG TPA: sigma-70 family RNA polymerase sigma factor [Baekduia sp.]|nr:sigma-70 family RNA polymerase sigma factor [Baekduia sp.]
MLDETRLAAAAASGDGAAFALLYEEYESRIFNFCLRLVGTQEDAADATQDAFVKVLQRLPKLEGRDLNFGAYLFTAARNASYDVIGKRKKADAVDEIPEFGATRLLGDERATDVQEPEKAVMVGALQAQVQAANAQLPERQREVLALRELEELSYDEIAEVMEMNRNSVAQLISRARISLRDQLRGDALASIAASTEACATALPMIAMQQDGQLAAGADAEWLRAHLDGCDTCKVSVEAMHEAGISYRAWTPIVPAALLWKETMAKAAEATNSDWRDLIERGRKAQSGAGGGAAGVFEEPDEAQGAGRRRVRRVVLALVGAVVFGLVVAGLVSGQLVSGENDPPVKPKPVSTAPATSPMPASQPVKKSRTKKTNTTPAPVTTPTSIVDATAPPPAEVAPETTKRKTSKRPVVTTTTPAPIPPPVIETTPTAPTPTVTTPVDPCAGMKGTQLAVCCRQNPAAASCVGRTQPPVIRLLREFG